MHSILDLTLILRTRSRRLHADEKGVVLVFVAILMTVMLGMLALVVDIGNGRQERRQAQTAADASALAAAEVLESRSYDFVFDIPTTWAQAVSQVKGYATQNWNIKTSDWQGCRDSGALFFKPDTASNNECISADFSIWTAPVAGDPINTVNRIRVHIPDKSMKSFFGGALGVTSLSTGATATAAVTRTTHTITKTLDTTTPGGPCALCILSPTGLTLDGQNGDISITGGGVTVNSTSSTAASLNPNGHVKIALPCDNSTSPPTCQTIGGPNAPANFSGAGYSPSPVVKSPVPDPLASVPQCGNGGLGDGTTTTVPSECPAVYTARNDNTTALLPGVYSSIKNSHTLAPGVYVLTGDISLNGNDLLQGDGVMLYMACKNYPTPCAPGEEGAGIKTTGNGAMRFTAPTTGTFKGLMMFADRNNTATQTFRGNGSNESGPQSGSSGTIYLKAGTMDLRGNGYTLASMIVTNNFTMKGNPSAVTLAYDLAKNYFLETHHTTTTTATSYSYDGTGLCSGSCAVPSG